MSGVELRNHHATILDLGEHGQGLVYMATDENDVLCCRYRVWLNDEVNADVAIKLPEGASDDTVNLWEGMQGEILRTITADKFIAAMKQMGVLT